MLVILGLGLVVSLAVVCKAAPMGTAWTYQGQLMDANEPADGLYDFEFKLYSDPNNIGFPIGPTIVINDLDVIDGYFIVELDFGDKVFKGDAKWLEVAVRPWDSTERHTTLFPRHQITPTPYALYAETTSNDNDWTVSGDDMYSAPSGNIGIGTTTPTAKLEVAGDMKMAIEDDITLSLVSGITNSSKIALGQRFNNESAFIELDNTTGVFRFGRPFESNSITIDGSGNVGVGTASPTKTLEVAGDMTMRLEDDITMSLVSGIFDSSTITLGQRFNPESAVIELDNYTGVLRFGRPLSNNSLTISSDGKVGIATASPDPNTKLHVDTDNIYAGYFTSDNPSSRSHVIHAEYTGSGKIGTVAVYGKSQSENSGTGGLFKGGRAGVEGSVNAIGSGHFIGAGGYVEGDDGYNYGVYGSASGNGINYGVYGRCSDGYAGYFLGDVYVAEDVLVIQNVSADSFTDRTPYPKDVATAYEAVMSMERLPDGQYDENNKETQLDHSMLSDFVRSKDGNRDLSATVSCHNEVLKDLISKQQELGKAHTYIEQLQKQNKLLEARLAKLEALIAKKPVK